METIKLDIIRPKIMTIKMLYLSLFLIFIGITLSFTINYFKIPFFNDHREILIGAPLIIGIIITYIIKVTYPTQNKGQITINNDKIDIDDKKGLRSFPLIELKTLTIEIRGYKGKEDWDRGMLTKDLYPYSTGTDNYLTIELKNGQKEKTTFFMQNEQIVNILKSRLETICNTFNIELKIK